MVGDEAALCIVQNTLAVVTMHSSVAFPSRCLRHGPQRLLSLALMPCQWFSWSTEVWTMDCASVKAVLGLGRERSAFPTHLLWLLPHCPSPFEASIFRQPFPSFLFISQRSTSSQSSYRAFRVTSRHPPGTHSTFLTLIPSSTPIIVDSIIPFNYHGSPSPSDDQGPYRQSCRTWPARW